jgi:hypothetical protein
MCKSDFSQFRTAKLLIFSRLPKLFPIFFQKKAKIAVLEVLFGSFAPQNQGNMQQFRDF